MSILNVILNGTGRFYLHLEVGTLGIKDKPLDNLSIYTDYVEKTIVIDGLLTGNTDFRLYALSGRIVSSEVLDISSTLQTIDVSKLNAGIYMVELISESNEKRIQKIIIK